MLNSPKIIKTVKPALVKLQHENTGKPIACKTLAYGTQYHRAPTPRPDEWQGDLEAIAEAGYTLVQLRPQWRWHERLRGRFVWDDMDGLMRLVEQVGLNVIIKPMLECAPDWVYSELQGTRMGFNNVPIPPKAVGAFYVGGWLPCFDNPDVCAAASEFVRRLVRRYKGHSELLLWNAWNEPRSRPLGECHCRHSVAAYQDYLANRFGTIETLNELFGKAWTAFDTIAPPVSGRDYAEMFLWRQWAFDAVAKRVRFVTKCIRQEDPQRSVMAHVGCSLIVQDTVCDSSDDHMNAAEVDFYGCSLPVQLYPANLHDMAGAGLQCDWLRSVDENYWCHELYPSWDGWREAPSQKFLERLIWNVVACGAKGIVYWQYRSERVGNESNGYGLREIDGSSTERSDVAAKTRPLRQNPRIILTTGKWEFHYQHRPIAD